MKPIHQRMPVLLPTEAYEQWLDSRVQDFPALHSWLRPYPGDDLRAYPVSTLVNNPRHDGPECLEPVAV